MYLKSLEMIGFKSFADKTKLTFEPGMTAIVGPNGCGKSNVSDAIRWVLGEQSAKALRGAKMEDCIFNGTQARKPLGMAEVSITFSDCEGLLETDYNEVTITRRVFRSGEGQYFMNKTPCRLRDIQRMFMGTGIGTSSYSVLAQGRIDQILSSRPEDRRVIFEEASGITKFKADKKEAIRKLEHTEANLIRLADVIREVKRQIGSLQRQAGKARKYKSLQSEMRDLDIYATRHRLTEMDRNLKQIEEQIGGLASRIQKSKEEVEEREKATALIRRQVSDTEHAIAEVVEVGSQAQSKLDRANDLIRINAQRIDEYDVLARRDGEELQELTAQLEARRVTLADVRKQETSARDDHERAAKQLETARERFRSHQEELDKTRGRMQELRDETVQVESLASRLQNQIVEIENRERSTVIQRERLTAEKEQLGIAAQQHQTRVVELEEQVASLTGETDTLAQALQQHEEQRAGLEARRHELQQQRSDVRSKAAATESRISVLTDAEEAEGDFPAGARAILEASNPLGIPANSILGPLANGLNIEQDYTIAAEAALRTYLDALVVNDAIAAKQIAATILEQAAGSVRLVPLQTNAPEPTGDGDRLIDHIHAPDAWRPLLQRLIGHVIVVDNASDLQTDDTTITRVTRDGLLQRATGALEVWKPDSSGANPLSRRNTINAATAALETLRNEESTIQQALEKVIADTESLTESIRTARQQLDAKRRELAQREGEKQMIQRESAQAKKRSETVTWELDELNERAKSSDGQRKELQDKREEARIRREQLSELVAAQSKELQQAELRHADLQSELAEKRIGAAGLAQKSEHLQNQLTGLEQRIEEMDRALQGRSRGIQGYQEQIAQLRSSTKETEAQLDGLKKTVEEQKAKATELRKSQQQRAVEQEKQESALGATRAALTELVEQRNDLNVKLTEQRMRHDNLIERITGEYNASLDDILESKDPDWEGQPLSLQDCETRVAELRAKLEAMGPVNLVAIDEYKEYEERYTFLTRQEEDLQAAKQQLMEMIKEINKTTSVMFRDTFEKANENFQSMFTHLFGGGSAKLVLVNEEDVLECGIEIIARPPGKRLQNVSLLSGGERTLTAVALLFAIYMIKPSPFCLLDELDAPLDDTNIARFCDVLRGFLHQSQFVVITHNRRTIAASNIIYGVTMPERGVSRIVSMKFAEDKGGVAIE